MKAIEFNEVLENSVFSRVPPSAKSHMYENKKKKLDLHVGLSSFARTRIFVA